MGNILNKSIMRQFLVLASIIFKVLIAIFIYLIILFKISNGAKKDNLSLMNFKGITKDITLIYQNQIV